MLCVLLNCWHCHYFSFSQRLFSRSKSLSHLPLIQWIELEKTCVYFGLNLKKLVYILDIRAFSIKMSIFLSFYLTFMNSKSGLEVNSWSYILMFTVFTRNQVDDITAVTRQIAFDITKPTCNLNLLSVNR